ncbi:MAG: Esterase EstB [Verrucomicrobiota bacterium]|jgi:CubicO group peptidase (beta-lactamase class C family)|nr:beta-lactamase family protein [Opitutaceae bacterium]
MRSFPALFPSIAACCLLSFSPAASAQDLAPAFQLVAQAVSDGRLPGATLLVMRHGTVLEHRAFGVRATEPARPFQIDTICWIASLTKPVTATAAMILVERGRLNLEEEVASYLPQFAGLATKDGRRHAVTVRQLLSHTSGIPVSVPLRERAFFNPTWLERGLPEVIEAIAARPLEFVPGTQVNYSNAAPYVVGRIVEVCSGRSFGEFVEAEILRPLGMRDTGFAVTETKIDRTAVVYRREKGVVTEFCRYDPAWRVRMTMPDGGLFSTPRDIALFAHSFLQARSPVLGGATVEAMLGRQSEGYGLGWILDRENQFSHWGSSGTLVWADRKTGVVGVFFAQMQDYAMLEKLRNAVRDAVDRAIAVR